MNNFVENNIGYAHAIAVEVLKTLPPHVDRADVESAAELGLVQSARAFDPTRGIPFTTFAYYRIRGAIYDEVRQSCRAARSPSSKFEEAANDFMTDYSSATSPGPVTYAELGSVVSNISTTYLLSLDAIPREPENRADEPPLEGLIREEDRDRVREAIARLPKRNREVLQAYYFEDLSLEEIGGRIGLSKSWVSRIHSRSIQLMREALANSDNDVPNRDVAPTPEKVGIGSQP